MITLYGSSRGRASRSLICLEELGLAYQQAPLKPWESEGDKARLLALNPNARVPVLDDDGLVVWESMAINLYLGDRYGGPLWPTSAADRARLYQWSVWGQTSIDVMARHLARFGKDPGAKAAAEAERLAVLAFSIRRSRTGRICWATRSRSPTSTSPRRSASPGRTAASTATSIRPHTA